MGMYANHGVEYRVILRDGKIIVIASTKATDERLERSVFYLSQKDEWMSADTMYGNGAFSKRIMDPHFDVQLTETERAELDNILVGHGESVKDHGWFDVNTISCSM
jgi:hypothetical protein